MMPQTAARLRNEEPSPRSRFAVLLNANARQVDARVRRELQGLVAPEDLFLSRDAGEARSIAELVVSRRYRTVFTGGGDGTFVGWVNHILDRAERVGAAAPRFGVLALGTGNAVAELVGSRPAQHLAQLGAFAGGAVERLRRVDLLTCDGRRTPFAGVGLDAAVLNDYAGLKARFAGTALRGATSGLAGYFLAGALRSAPRYLAERRPSYCEIVNLGRAACRLDGRGRQVGPTLGHGELIYAGPCMLAAASTVPFYGFGLRAFPFAGARPGTMQLRVAAELSVPTFLWNLPRIWSGDFAHPGLLDFHAERVSVQFERPMPLQVGGDAEGWRDSVTFGLTPRPLDVVDFTVPPARRPRLMH